MISYLEGKISQIDPTFVLMEVGGIGYHVKITLNTYSHLKVLKKCKVHTHLHVKEDSHTLFGFFEESERKRFRQLISISGVGLTTGIIILSSLSPSEIHSAIVNSDVKTINGIKGVGQKTAQRIILELKDKMSKEELEGQSSVISLSPSNSLKLEALSALTILGMNKGVAEKKIDKLLRETNEEVSLEELIKLALKRA